MKISNAIQLSFALWRLVPLSGAQDLARGLSWAQSAHRRLVAMDMIPELRPRDSDFHPRSESILHYVDETTLEQERPFMARATIKGRVPMVLLEDLDMHIQEVGCEGSMIHVRFGTPESMRKAQQSWGGLEEFLLVTSHPGCNANGERVPYRVAGMEVDEVQGVASFRAQVDSWHDATESVTVEFGGGERSLISERFLESNRLGRRATSSASASSSSSASITPPPFSYPSLTASPTTTATKPIESISISYTNFPILPPQNPALNYVANKLLGDGSIKLSCQNCSLVGDMAISYGSVNMTSSKALSEMVSALTGQVQVTVQNLSGHIELRTEISASKSMDFTAHLPQIPLTPFEIPGFALIGPVVDPQIVGSLTLSSDVDFIYGFDVSVPDGSYVTLDLSNRTNSSIHGFDQTKVSPIPFQAGAEMALNASLSLRPEVLITISLFDNAATVGAGFYVDLPRVSVEVAQVFDVDAQCERTSTSASAFSDLQYAAASLKFGSLTHLVPHVELDLGVNMYAHLEEPFSSADDKNGSLTTDLVLLQTTYALPTACLSFDAEHKTFLDAQLAAQQLAATGTAVDDAHTTKTTTKTTSGAGRSLAWPLNDGALTVLMATVTVTVMLL